MKAIILAAGQGSRMGELTKSLPKPLMKFGEQTIISRLVNQLISRKITNIDIVVGYLYIGSTDKKLDAPEISNINDFVYKWS